MRHHFIFLLQLCIVLITNTLCDFCCCCYRKGTNFQANHNMMSPSKIFTPVVVATAKVRIFKQITTRSDAMAVYDGCCCYRKGTNFQANHNMKVKEKMPSVLLLLPQRYEFSSKSQQRRHTATIAQRCCCYRKGTNFQANHNWIWRKNWMVLVVVATAKVRIFKQITTRQWW